MKSISKEIKIALVAIIGLVVLYFGMSFLKGVSMFSSDNTYYVKFDKVSGLTPSCPIMADGYKVGTVKSIDYDYSRKGGIIAEVGLHKDLQIPVGTTAEISSDLLVEFLCNSVRVDTARRTNRRKHQCRCYGQNQRNHTAGDEPPAKG